MEIITLDEAVNVIYIEAASFPDGVLAAHQQLHSKIPFSTDRKYFGLSRPESGMICYKAGAEEKYEGEAEKLNCKSVKLKEGRYVSLIVKDFMKDPQSIAAAFNQLLTSPNLDREGYCVEWYVNDTDVQCMIRLNN